MKERHVIRVAGAPKNGQLYVWACEGDLPDRRTIVVTRRLEDLCVPREALDATSAAPVTIAEIMSYTVTEVSDRWGSCQWVNVSRGTGATSMGFGIRPHCTNLTAGAVQYRVPYLHVPPRSQFGWHFADAAVELVDRQLMAMNPSNKSHYATSAPLEFDVHPQAVLRFQAARVGR